MSQQTVSNIDIGKYRGSKSPIIPTCLRICSEEILSRTQIGQLRLLPSSWSSLYARSNIFREKKPDEVQALLDRLGADRKYTTTTKEDAPLSAHCVTMSTEKILATFLEYLLRCKPTLNVKLTYPSLGWIVMGPAYLIPFEMIDEAHYTREMVNLLDALFEQAPVRRDMICYLMALVSDLVQTVNVAYREQPSLLSIVRYQICHLLGPILFSVVCENCKGVLTDGSRPCDVCSVVVDLLQDPYPADVMDRMVRHLTGDFWRSCMNANRTGTYSANKPAQIQQEILSMFVNKGGSRPLRPRAEQPIQVQVNSPKGTTQALQANPSLNKAQIPPGEPVAPEPPGIPVRRHSSRIVGTANTPTSVAPSSLPTVVAQRSSQRMSRRVSSDAPLQRLEDRVIKVRTPSVNRHKPRKKRTPRKARSATPKLNRARRAKVVRRYSTSRISRAKHRSKKTRRTGKTTSRSP